MRETIKVLCFVMTNGRSHKSKARHVRYTWGRRCNEILFFSNVHDSRLPVIVVDLEPKKNSWEKTVSALQYLYLNKFNQYDWFAKADDTTYYVMDNLRFLLLPYDPMQPLVFGLRYSCNGTLDGYVTEKGGYVISKQALQRLVINGFAKMENIIPGR